MFNPSFFATRRFGAIAVTVVDEGTGWYRMPVLDGEGNEIDAFGPDSPDGLPIGFHVAHIKTPEASVLVDAGFDDPDSEWGKKFAKEWFVKRTPGLGEALRSIGQTPESITHLAITHAHFDHVAGLTAEMPSPGALESGPTSSGSREDRSDALIQLRFPHAWVFLGEADAARIGPRADDGPEASSEDIRRRLKLVRDAGRLTSVPAEPPEDSEHQIRADRSPADAGFEITPGILMLHTGGESAGHSVVVAGDWEFAAAGDLFHYPFEIEHPDWMAPWAAREDMLVARQWFLRQASEAETVVMFSHSPFPPWGRIRREGGGYRWESG